MSETVTTRGLILQGIVTAAGLAIAQALLNLFDTNLSWRVRMGKILIAIAVVITVIIITRTLLRDPKTRSDPEVSTVKRIFENWW
jgi:hypothetical protein